MGPLDVRGPGFGDDKKDESPKFLKEGEFGAFLPIREHPIGGGKLQGSAGRQKSVVRLSSRGILGGK